MVPCGLGIDNVTTVGAVAPIPEMVMLPTEVNVMELGCALIVTGKNMTQ